MLFIRPKTKLIIDHNVSSFKERHITISNFIFKYICSNLVKLILVDIYMYIDSSLHYCGLIFKCHCTNAKIKFVGCLNGIWANWVLIGFQAVCYIWCRLLAIRCHSMCWSRNVSVKRATTAFTAHTIACTVKKFRQMIRQS